MHGNEKVCIVNPAQYIDWLVILFPLAHIESTIDIPERRHAHKHTLNKRQIATKGGAGCTNKIRQLCSFSI